MTDSPQAGMEQHPSIMTLEEVAEYLRVHKSTIYRMAREGSIPSSKVANQWRFRRRALTSGLWSVRTKGLPIDRKVFGTVPASLQLMIEAVTSS